MFVLYIFFSCLFSFALGMILEMNGKIGMNLIITINEIMCWMDGYNMGI